MYIPITKARDLPKENKFSGFEIIRYSGSLIFGKSKTALSIAPSCGRYDYGAESQKRGLEVAVPNLTWFRWQPAATLPVALSVVGFAFGNAADQPPKLISVLTCAHSRCHTHEQINTQTTERDNLLCSHKSMLLLLLPC